MPDEFTPEESRNFALREMLTMLYVMTHEQRVALYRNYATACVRDWPTEQREEYLSDLPDALAWEMTERWKNALEETLHITRLASPQVQPDQAGV